MEDQSHLYAHLNLRQGERVYKLKSGHTFKLYMIRDDERSSHGKEVMWMQSTEIDANTKDYHIRKDGKVAVHENGHHVYSFGAGEYRNYQDDPITLREWVLLEREAYMDRSARISDLHVAVNDLDDLLVSSRDAHYIPDCLPHLKPEKRDEYDNVVPHIVN